MITFSLSEWQKLKSDPNGLRVLKTIRECKLLSRTDVSELCGLSKAAVSDIVNKHIERGLVREIGKKSSTPNGGKPQTILEFNPKAGLVAGVEIDVTRSTVILTDLNANILERAIVEFRAGSTANYVFTLIFSVLDSLLKSYERQGIQLMGIGVGLPGLIDTRTGIVTVADTLKGWERIDVRTAFEKQFHVPVHVENDVKARTLAESMFGSGKGVNDLIFLWVGYGIGAGIFLNGKLHRGVSFSAGEVGYNELGFLISDPNEFPILYQQQRYVGELISDSVLVGAVKEHLGRGTGVPLLRDREITVKSIADAAAEGDELCGAALREFATVLSVVAINLINTLNPEMLILGGKVIQTNNFVLDLVRQQLHRDFLTAPVEVVDVKAGVFGDDAVVVGAAGLVLYDFFEEPSVSSYIQQTRVGTSVQSQSKF